MDLSRPTAEQKAFKINMDASKHGTFAEIGAGQEVVRWFFHAGGASGTVAKTISAYDMKVSDAIYGPTERYVSRRHIERSPGQILQGRAESGWATRDCP
jgi:hypothetical protein